MLIQHGADMLDAVLPVVRGDNGSAPVYSHTLSLLHHHPQAARPGVDVLACRHATMPREHKVWSIPPA